MLIVDQLIGNFTLQVRIITQKCKLLKWKLISSLWWLLKSRVYPRKITGFHNCFQSQMLSCNILKWKIIHTERWWQSLVAIYPSWIQAKIILFKAYGRFQCMGLRGYSKLSGDIDRPYIKRDFLDFCPKFMRNHFKISSPIIYIVKSLLCVFKVIGSPCNMTNHDISFSNSFPMCTSFTLTSQVYEFY